LQAPRKRRADCIIRVVKTIKFGRTLIVEQNREYVIQLKEILKDRIHDVEFAFDGKRAIEIYREYHPDLVLVEAILPKYDGFALLEHIQSDDIVKIMLTCINEPLIIKKAFALKADYVFVKPYERGIILDRLDEIVAFKKSHSKWNYVAGELPPLRNRIANILKKLGIPAKVLGYRYIKEALIIMCEEQPDVGPTNFRRLYAEIARRFDTKEKCVERNIRHAIETAANRGDPDALLCYFGYSMDSEKGKPTNGEFLSALKEIINLEME